MLSGRPRSRLLAAMSVTLITFGVHPAPAANADMPGHQVTQADSLSRVFRRRRLAVATLGIG
jgi:hypothetical protein